MFEVVFGEPFPCEGEKRIVLIDGVLGNWKTRIMLVFLEKASMGYRRVLGYVRLNAESENIINGVFHLFPLLIWQPSKDIRSNFIFFETCP